MYQSILRVTLILIALAVVAIATTRSAHADEGCANCNSCQNGDCNTRHGDKCRRHGDGCKGCRDKGCNNCRNCRGCKNGNDCGECKAGLCQRIHDAHQYKRYRVSQKGDLFYNYYVPAGDCPGSVPAAMYPTPMPTPPWVGHTYVTYQPLMPHEFMYKHRRSYKAGPVEGSHVRTKITWW